MTAPGSGPTNTAQDSATVGVQAEAVHEVHIYQPSADASPHERAQAGIAYLRGGMAGKAREHLRDAVIGGHVTSRSCYYLLLSIVSDRMLEQIPGEDFALLRTLRGTISELADDPCSSAVRVISRLLTSAAAGDAEHETIDQKLEELPDDHRDEILRHLEMFLSGPIQDGLWERAFDSARQNQCRDQRLERAWKFFHPDPARPRVRPPRPIEITPAHWVRSITASVGCLVLAGFIAVQAWQHAGTSTAIALLLATVGCGACARSGVEWRFLVERLRAAERAHTASRPQAAPAPQGGFANRIDRRFDRYFRRYVPRGTDRQTWLTHTAGIRQSLRDEIVELYRESRTPAERVAWLVRHLAGDVSQRWDSGTLWDYRDRLRVPTATKVTFLLGTAGFAVGAATTIWNGLHTHPLAVAGATAAALVTGKLATTGWLSIAVEHKRVAADHADIEREDAKRTAAYDRWKTKLNDRPSDEEMARWLDCDRRALREKAIRHYKLEPHGVIAHAFIEAPATSYRRRARVQDGPWRYSRYRLVIFLLTTYGVRQMTVDLDFENASFHQPRRIDYRYDAVAAVQVNETDNGHIVFTLTLVDGNPIETTVTEPPPKTDEPEEESKPAQPEPEEDTRSVPQGTVDTADLGHTLHILEGIAAEGKEWIAHQRQRERARLPDLAQAVRSILS